MAELRCPKCYVDFDDEGEFREHYRQHLDGAPPPEAIVERARHFEGEWDVIEEAWRDAGEDVCGEHVMGGTCERVKGHDGPCSRQERGDERKFGQ